MSIEFRESTALVTGAASGIGRSVAMKLAAEGAGVLLVDIDREGLRSVANDIGLSGGRASFYVTDVSDAGQVEELRDRVAAEHGTPDILVNSAGVVIGGAIDQIPLAEWEWLLGVNLWGVINTVHHFSRDMYERGSGNIVNLASAAGLMALPYLSLYTTSKFAVVGFSKVLRAEASVHGVKVTTVCPGFVRTPMLDNVKAVGMEVDSSEDSTMKRHAMSPDELADRIVRAMEKGTAVVVCPYQMKLLYGISKYFPRLWDSFISLNARIAHKTMGVRR
jgi:short-subunit dehydrogenase